MQTDPPKEEDKRPETGGGLLETVSKLCYALLTGLLSSIKDLVRFCFVYILVYVVMTPFLYVSSNYEGGLHSSVLASALVKDLLNLIVFIANLAIDVFRPFQPLWNFVFYWQRRFTFLAARVAIIGIEEIVENLIAPPASVGGDPNSMTAIPGCRNDDWTSFADLDVQVCLFDFDTIAGFPGYDGRSKIVSDLPALMDGTHEQADEFWDVMLNYAGPQEPVHHPPSYYTRDERLEWWESKIQDRGDSNLDGAHYAIPLGHWADTDAERDVLKAEVQSYFNSFPDISIAMYIWDLVFSAMVYALIDGFGFVADILYDLAEFFAVLLLYVATDMIQSLLGAGKFLFSNVGQVSTLFVSVMQDTFLILYQFFSNGATCLLGLTWFCSSVSETYTCCDNWQLWTQAQCANPATSNPPEFPESAFGPVTPWNIDQQSDHNHVYRESMTAGTGIEKVTSYVYPLDDKMWWDNYTSIRTDQRADKDTWPFADELDDDVYDSSLHGLNGCRGPGPCTDWECEDSVYSYLNPTFNKSHEKTGVVLPSDASAETCTPFVADHSGVLRPNPNAVSMYNWKSNTVDHACVQHHTKQTCIRATEHKTFLSLDIPSFRGTKRSASSELDAVSPEANKTKYGLAINRTCNQGCGDETTQGTCGSLDYWGYRTLDVWDCTDYYAKADNITNGKEAVYTWFLGGCLRDAATWQGKDPPCGANQKPEEDKMRHICQTYKSQCRNTPANKQHGSYTEPLVSASDWDAYMLVGGCAIACDGINTLNVLDDAGTPTIISLPASMVGLDDADGEIVPPAHPFSQHQLAPLWYGTNFEELVTSNVKLSDYKTEMEKDGATGKLYQLMNYMNKITSCKLRTEVKYAFPRFCTCGFTACSNPLLVYLFAELLWLYEEFKSLISCGFDFTAHRCCMAAEEPNKPGMHVSGMGGGYTYHNFGPSIGIAVDEAVEIGANDLGDTYAEGSTSLEDLIAVSDELRGGGLGSGQPCFFTSTLLGTAPQCKYDQMEEECCGYCTAWLHKFTNVSYHTAEARARAIIGETDDPDWISETQEESIDEFTRKMQVRQKRLGQASSLRKDDIMPRNGHCDYQSSDSSLGELSGLALLSAVDPVVGAAADLFLKYVEGTKCLVGTQTRTEFSLEPAELGLLAVTMFERDISYGSLLPGFGLNAALGICNNDIPPKVGDSGSNLASCPVSALYALRWAGHLNLARHQSALVGMPFDSPDAVPRSGFGFWRRMIYMEKFNRNNYRWWEHIQGNDYHSRLPCGCTTPNFCPGHKSKLPWNQGASLHSSGIHGYLQQRFGDVGGDQATTMIALHMSLLQAGYKNDEAALVAHARYGIPASDRKHAVEVCSATASNSSAGMAVDLGADGGTWREAMQFCTDWKNPYSCAMKERSFCHYYNRGPTHTDPDPKHGNALGYVPDTAKHQDGSNGYIGANEHRTRSGAVTKTKALLRPEAGALIPPEFQLYFDSLHMRHHTMTNLMRVDSPWWAHNVEQRSQTSDECRRFPDDLLVECGIPDAAPATLDECATWPQPNALNHYTFMRDEPVFSRPDTRDAYVSGCFECHVGESASSWDNYVQGYSTSDRAHANLQTRRTSLDEYSDTNCATKSNFTQMNFSACREAAFAQVYIDDPNSLSKVTNQTAVFTVRNIQRPGWHSAELCELAWTPRRYGSLSLPARLLAGKGVAVSNDDDSSYFYKEALGGPSRLRQGARSEADFLAKHGTRFIARYATLDRTRHNVAGLAQRLLASQERTAYNPLNLSLSAAGGDYAGKQITNADVNIKENQIGDPTLYELHDTLYGSLGRPGPFERIPSVAKQRRLNGMDIKTAAYNPVRHVSANDQSTADTVENPYTPHMFSQVMAEYEALRRVNTAPPSCFMDYVPTTTGSQSTLLAPEPIRQMLPAQQVDFDRYLASTDFMAGMQSDSLGSYGITTQLTPRQSCWSAVARLWSAVGYPTANPSVNAALDQLGVDRNDAAAHSTVPDRKPVRKTANQILELLRDWRTRDTAAVDTNQVWAEALLTLLADGTARDAESGKWGFPANSAPLLRHDTGSRYGMFFSGNMYQPGQGVRAPRACDRTVQNNTSGKTGLETGQLACGSAQHQLAGLSYGYQAHHLLSGTPPDATALQSATDESDVSAEVSAIMWSHLREPPLHDIWFANLTNRSEPSPQAQRAWREFAGDVQPPRVGDSTDWADQMYEELTSPNTRLYNSMWAGMAGRANSVTRAQRDSAVQRFLKFFTDKVSNEIAASPPEAVRLHTVPAPHGVLSPDYDATWTDVMKGSQKVVTTQEMESFVCLDYDHDQKPGEKCIPLTATTKCNTFARSQQTVEAAGLFDATDVSCFKGPRATILEQDFDPTIGCLSDAWSTVFAREHDGTEIEQCCDGCSAASVILRDTVSCFGNWDKCSQSFETLVGDVLCTTLGPLINAIMKTLHEVASLMQTLGIGQGSKLSATSVAESLGRYVVKDVTSITDDLLSCVGQQISNNKLEIWNDFRVWDIDACISQRELSAPSPPPSKTQVLGAVTEVTSAESTLGPEASKGREVNYCNFCCDQVKHYCEENNFPGAKCYQCNNQPVGQCGIPSAVPDELQNYLGYCYEQPGADACTTTKGVMGTSEKFSESDFESLLGDDSAGHTMGARHGNTLNRFQGDAKMDNQEDLPDMASGIIDLLDDANVPTCPTHEGVFVNDERVADFRTNDDARIDANTVVFPTSDYWSYNSHIQDYREMLNYDAAWFSTQDEVATMAQVTGTPEIKILEKIADVTLRPKNLHADCQRLIEYHVHSTNKDALLHKHAMEVFEKYAKDLFEKATQRICPELQSTMPMNSRGQPLATQFPHGTNPSSKPMLSDLSAQFETLVPVSQDGQEVMSKLLAPETHINPATDSTTAVQNYNLLETFLEENFDALKGINFESLPTRNQYVTLLGPDNKMTGYNFTGTLQDALLAHDATVSGGWSNTSIQPTALWMGPRRDGLDRLFVVTEPLTSQNNRGGVDLTEFYNQFPRNGYDFGNSTGKRVWIPADSVSSNEHTTTGQKSVCLRCLLNDNFIQSLGAHMFPFNPQNAFSEIAKLRFGTETTSETAMDSMQACADLKREIDAFMVSFANATLFQRLRPYTPDPTQPTGRLDCQLKISKTYPAGWGVTPEALVSEHGPRTPPVQTENECANVDSSGYNKNNWWRWADSEAYRCPVGKHTYTQADKGGYCSWHATLPYPGMGIPGNSLQHFKFSDSVNPDLTWSPVDNSDWQDCAVNHMANIAPNNPDDPVWAIAQQLNPVNYIFADGESDPELLVFPKTPDAWNKVYSDIQFLTFEKYIYPFINVRRYLRDTVCGDMGLSSKLFDYGELQNNRYGSDASENSGMAEPLQNTAGTPMGCQRDPNSVGGIDSIFEVYQALTKNMQYMFPDTWGPLNHVVAKNFDSQDGYENVEQGSMVSDNQAGYGENADRSQAAKQAPWICPGATGTWLEPDSSWDCWASALDADLKHLFYPSDSTLMPESLANQSVGQKAMGPRAGEKVCACQPVDYRNLTQHVDSTHDNTKTPVSRSFPQSNPFATVAWFSLKLQPLRWNQSFYIQIPELPSSNCSPAVNIEDVSFDDPRRAMHEYSADRLLCGLLDSWADLTALDIGLDDWSDLSNVMSTLTDPSVKNWISEGSPCGVVEPPMFLLGTEGPSDQNRLSENLNFFSSGAAHSDPRRQSHAWYSGRQHARLHSPTRGQISGGTQSLLPGANLAVELNDPHHGSPIQTFSEKARDFFAVNATSKPYGAKQWMLDDEYQYGAYDDEFAPRAKHLPASMTSSWGLLNTRDTSKWPPLQAAYAEGNPVASFTNSFYTMDSNPAELGDEEFFFNPLFPLDRFENPGIGEKWETTAPGEANNGVPQALYTGGRDCGGYELSHARRVSDILASCVGLSQGRDDMPDLCADLFTDVSQFVTSTPMVVLPKSSDDHASMHLGLEHAALTCTPEMYDLLMAVADTSTPSSMADAKIILDGFSSNSELFTEQWMLLYEAVVGAGNVNIAMEMLKTAMPMTPQFCCKGALAGTGQCSAEVLNVYNDLDAGSCKKPPNMPKSEGFDSATGVFGYFDPHHCCNKDGGLCSVAFPPQLENGEIYVGNGGSTCLPNFKMWQHLETLYLFLTGNMQKKPKTRVEELVKYFGFAAYSNSEAGKPELQAKLLKDWTRLCARVEPSTRCSPIPASRRDSNLANGPKTKSWLDKQISLGQQSLATGDFDQLKNNISYITELARGASMNLNANSWASALADDESVPMHAVPDVIQAALQQQSLPLISRRLNISYCGHKPGDLYTATDFSSRTHGRRLNTMLTRHLSKAAYDYASANLNTTEPTRAAWSFSHDAAGANISTVTETEGWALSAATQICDGIVSESVPPGLTPMRKYFGAAYRSLALAAFKPIETLADCLANNHKNQPGVLAGTMICDGEVGPTALQWMRSGTLLDAIEKKSSRSGGRPSGVTDALANTESTAAWQAVNAETLSVSAAGYEPAYTPAHEDYWFASKYSRDIRPTHEDHYVASTVSAPSDNMCLILPPNERSSNFTTSQDNEKFKSRNKEFWMQWPVGLSYSLTMCQRNHVTKGINAPVTAFVGKALLAHQNAQVEQQTALQERSLATDRSMSKKKVDLGHRGTHSEQETMDYSTRFSSAESLINFPCWSMHTGMQHVTDDSGKTKTSLEYNMRCRDRFSPIKQTKEHQQCYNRLECFSPNYGIADHDRAASVLYKDSNTREEDVVAEPVVGVEQTGFAGFRSPDFVHYIVSGKTPSKYCTPPNRSATAEDLDENGGFLHMYGVDNIANFSLKRTRTKINWDEVDQAKNKQEAFSPLDIELGTEDTFTDSNANCLCPLNPKSQTRYKNCLYWTKYLLLREQGQLATDVSFYDGKLKGVVGDMDPSPNKNPSGAMKLDPLTTKNFYSPEYAHARMVFSLASAPLGQCRDPRQPASQSIEFKKAVTVIEAALLTAYKATFNFSSPLDTTTDFFPGFGPVTITTTGHDTTTATMCDSLTGGISAVSKGVACPSNAATTGQPTRVAPPSTSATVCTSLRSMIDKLPTCEVYQNSSDARQTVQIAFRNCAIELANEILAPGVNPHTPLTESNQMLKMLETVTKMSSNTDGDLNFFDCTASFYDFGDETRESKAFRTNWDNMRSVSTDSLNLAVNRQLALQTLRAKNIFPGLTYPKLYSHWSMWLFQTAMTARSNPQPNGTLHNYCNNMPDVRQVNSTTGASNCMEAMRIFDFEQEPDPNLWSTAECDRTAGSHSCDQPADPMVPDGPKLWDQVWKNTYTRHFYSCPNVPEAVAGSTTTAPVPRGSYNTLVKQFQTCSDAQGGCTNLTFHIDPLTVSDGKHDYTHYNALRSCPTAPRLQVWPPGAAVRRQTQMLKPPVMVGFITPDDAACTDTNCPLSGQSDDETRHWQEQLHGPWCGRPCAVEGRGIVGEHVYVTELAGQTLNQATSDSSHQHNHQRARGFDASYSQDTQANRRRAEAAPDDDDLLIVTDEDGTVTDSTAPKRAHFPQSAWREFAPPAAPPAAPPEESPAALRLRMAQALKIRSDGVTQALAELNAAFTPQARDELLSIVRGKGQFEQPAWRERFEAGDRTHVHQTAVMLRDGAVDDSDDSNCGKLLRAAAAIDDVGAHPDRMDNTAVVAWKACAAIHLAESGKLTRGGSHVTDGTTGHAFDRFFFGANESNIAGAVASAAVSLANSLAGRALPSMQVRVEAREQKLAQRQRFRRRQVQDRITALGLDAPLARVLQVDDGALPLLHEAKYRSELKSKIMRQDAAEDQPLTAPRESTDESLELVRATSDLIDQGRADASALMSDTHRMREHLNMFQLKNREEMTQYTQWANGVEQRAVAKLGGMQRQDSESATITARGVIANALKDADAFARQAEPMLDFAARATNEKANDIQTRFPDRIGFLSNRHAPAVEYPSSLQQATSAVWESAAASASVPDLDTNLGVEAVRRGTSSFLSALDAKAYLFDAMGVRSKRQGEEWADPTARRNARHDSRSHTPLGRVVRGGLSRVFPDHYDYRDHDVNGTGWVTSMMPASPLITKNLSTADFMWFNTILRQRPHASMGNRLANPKTASSVIRKIAMLIEGAHGADHLISLHPRADKLREHSLRVEQKHHDSARRRRVLKESSAADKNAERRRLIESFVQDAVDAQDLMSVASAVGSSQHKSLDARVSKKLSEDCNAGGDKRSWRDNGCGIENVFDLSNPRCAGCKACLGCDVRPPSCGGVGRVTCESDVDCLDTRHCDEISCSFDKLMPQLSTLTEKSDAQVAIADRSSIRCNSGPHFTDMAANDNTDAFLNTNLKDILTERMQNLHEYLFSSAFYCYKLTVGTVATQSCATVCDGGGLLDALDPASGEHMFATSTIKLPKLELYKDAQLLTEWKLCKTKTPRDNTVCVNDNFFGRLRRNCKTQDGYATQYLRPVANCADKDCYQSLAPLNLQGDDTGPGFTCSCMRPRASAISEYLPYSETCICGDFADQPIVGGALDLTSPQFIADYLMYNFVLCNLYMQAEHTCFPSVPYEIPTLPEFDWSVRALLSDNSVNFTCANATGKDEFGPVCDDHEVFPRAYCPEYHALINDDRALVPVLRYSGLYVTNGIYNRLYNTAVALQFIVRSVAQLTGELGRSFGRVTRAVLRLLTGGLLAAPGIITIVIGIGLRRKYAPNNRRANFAIGAALVFVVAVEHAMVVNGNWNTLLGAGVLRAFSNDGVFQSPVTFPVCDDVDYVATLCEGDRCPRCCNQPGGGKDCFKTCGRYNFENGVDGYAHMSTYTDRENARFWTTCADSLMSANCVESVLAFATYSLRAHEAYATPLEVNRQCVGYEATAPPANAAICFWLQIGTCVWTMLGLAFLTAVWNSTRQARVLFVQLMDQLFMKVWARSIPEDLHEELERQIRQGRFDVALHTRNFHWVREKMNMRDFSPVQVARGVARRWSRFFGTAH